MDKVQFNTQMVNMRKTVKRAKVQLIHRLTRQIMVIRKKKGSGKQIVKNERRAGRLVKEIEVIKDLPCDELTMSAVINKQSLQAVLDNANSTAVERGTARLINHRLISQQVATFKDLVTDDLLEIGKRKEKLMSRTKEGTTRKTERKGSESSHEDEEEEEDSLEEGSNTGEASDDDDDDEMKISPMQTMGAGRSKKSESSSLSEQNQRLREQMESRHKKSEFLMIARGKGDRNQEGESDGVEEDGSEEEEEDDDDVESLEDMDDDLDEMGENFNAEFRELTAEFKKGRNNSSGQVEKEKKKSKGLDSLFVGKLSGKSRVSSDRNDKSKKNRPGQKERQKINIKNQLHVLRRPSKKEAGEGSRHVALVDLPSLDTREKRPPKRKVILGINAYAPFEKPKTADSSNEKLLPSQRSMAFPMSKRGRGGARGGGRGGGGGRPFLQTPAQAPEVLHPSWEAKKKMKEQESKILPFTGKKITFDD